MTILKQSTIDAIEASSQFLVSFEKYGTHHNAKTKISITYYCQQYAYTVQAWAIISRIKYQQLSGYGSLCGILKPSDFSAIRTDKATGEDVSNDNQASCKAVFQLLCNALEQSTDKVHLDQYQTIKNKSKIKACTPEPVC